MNKNNLIWIDLEMTGLNPQQDKIIEIATIVTNYNLEIIATGPEIVIYQPDEILNQMDNWNLEQHGKSGLLEKVSKSNITEAAAEQQTLNFLMQHVLNNTSPMCGNSIYQDRRFLSKYMPQLEAFFHYRNLDVSTLKLLAQYWNPNLDKFLKSSDHRAKNDIIDSIEELKFYRKNFIKI